MRLLPTSCALREEPLALAGTALYLAAALAPAATMLSRSKRVPVGE
jgi:hypothetical protein